ncbi:hypothetical protein FVEG_15216 [Fusarium verticillioides 7600]|uniref:Uncharacterized protein n=1 Tax=Gibberella moniliformis (strain M3125 / FGSC 7600) TaxID=334819 RepID=W7LR66_GIBM7|nr:hypothetical protein FVEG_15216 [Fusarium verticillioides 7600]EWG41026.1 hypothetical protein FVEG_15216 [Fusarium verticillioides 7600]
MSCHIFEGAFASCRATDSWPTGHTYPSRHSVRSPSFPAEGKRRRWCAGIPWKNMEVLSSLAGGSAWLQSLTPRGCQSHANLHRRPTLREQLFDEKLNPQLLILLVSSHFVCDCVDLPGP